MKKLISTFILLLAVGIAYAQTACNPAFTWAAAPSGNNLLRISFTNTTSFTPPVPQAYATYFINFGDNSSSNFWGGTSYHNYSTPGTYNVKLYMDVYDSLNQTLICNAIDSQLVTVAYSACATSISAVMNSAGNYTFTANTPASPSGMTYSWNFGDGSTGTGSPVTHVYNTPGTYTITLSASGGGCAYTNTYVVQSSSTNPCANLNAAFSHNSNNLTTVVSNTSTFGSPLIRVAHWNFGDGSPIVSNTNYTSHTYAASGLYLIVLTNEWKDSATQAIVCTDVVSQTVSVSNAPQQNLISGNIIWDSLSNPTVAVSFKVWLIVQDSLANTLAAIDSTTTSGMLGTNFAPYSFQNALPRNYLVKAAPIYNSPVVSGLVPTYHDSSIYWTGANLVAHAGGNTPNVYIWMRSGTPTSGPGFIGGNISLGANKGTAAGAPNQLVYLRNAANHMVRFTYTDANGDYSFGNIPTGSYTVYPEELRYTTIPSSILSVTAGQPSVANVDFKKTPTHFKPTNGITGINNLSLSNEFVLFPNPANNALSVYTKASFTGSATIDIITLTGAKALSKASVAGKETVVDLSSLQSGVYFVRITAGNEQHVEKLFIQH